MADIDVGAAATDRSFTVPQGYTLIAMENPANDDGTIDTVAIWAGANMSNCKVGTFYGSGSSYTSRDSASLGTVTAGSKQTFSGLSIDVESGDYIGIYYSAGNIEADFSGSGVRYKAGDQFGQGAQTYGMWSNLTMSLYGSGETAGGWGHVFLGVSSPGEVLGVASANIDTVNGV
jgi:hypothetical protein